MFHEESSTIVSYRDDAHCCNADAHGSGVVYNILCRIGDTAVVRLKLSQYDFGAHTRKTMDKKIHGLRMAFADVCESHLQSVLWGFNLKA